MNRVGLLLAVVSLTPMAGAGVIVVDAAGGGDFTTLTAAVAAAASGDTLLVRDGHYVEAGPVVIDGKSLVVTGEWASQPFLVQVAIEPGLIVRNLAPGQGVVLQNLAITGASSSAAVPAKPALTLLDNVAHVRVQDCKLFGGGGLHNDNPNGAACVELTNSLSNAMVGSFLGGGQGQFSPSLATKTGNGGPAVLMAGSQVLLSDTSAYGGSGGSNNIGGWPTGGKGGNGVTHSTGLLLPVSSSLLGGDGGTAHNGGDGGVGLSMGTAGFAWFLGGSWANGGSGGWSDEGPDGADGANIVDASHLVTNYGGSFHLFDLTSPLREGQVGTLKLQGQPADVALLFASLSLHQIPFVGHDGVLMLAPTALIGPFTLGPPGNQDLPFLAPDLPLGLESLVVHVQPVYVGAGGSDLGTGRVLTLLDAAF